MEFLGREKQGKTLGQVEKIGSWKLQGKTGQKMARTILDDLARNQQRVLSQVDI